MYKYSDHSRTTKSNEFLAETAWPLVAQELPAPCTHSFMQLTWIHLTACDTIESESYTTTDGQSASLSWNKAPFWGLRPDLDYCPTVAGLLMWGALSDERTGLLFAIATGPRQHSHSRVRIPWDSRPYFTVSDLRLPFSSPPTTLRVTVEVFVPASKRDVRHNLRNIALI
jgi:hypothetical protein